MGKYGMVLVTKRKLPPVNKIGEKLEDAGFVRFKNGRYDQVGPNCYEIARELASSFGYVTPSVRDAYNKLVHGRSRLRRSRCFGTPFPPDLIRSPANLVIRQTDNALDVHFTFELLGREYNFGPTSKDGFYVELRIPLSAIQ